jgi:transposase-like protein
MNLRTPENAQAICEMLERGMSLRKVADEIGCDEAAIRQWAREDEAFAPQYARARDGYSDAKGDEIIDLADEAREKPELVNSLRLMIDTRKWYLSKVLPKKFGDKLDLNHGGQNGDNPVRITYGWQE